MHKAQASLDYLLAFGGVVVVFLLATALYLSITGQETNLIKLGFSEREKTFIDNVYIKYPRYDDPIKEEDTDVLVLVLPKRNLKNVSYYIKKSSDGSEVFKYHSPRDEFENVAKSSSGNFYKSNFWVSETLVMINPETLEPDPNILQPNELYDLIMEVQYQNDVNELFIQKKSIIGS